MAHPVAWIQRGSDRWYALAAAVANPILVATFARFVGGKPIGERRIFLGAVAYALPYVAMWSIVGFAFGERSEPPRAQTSLTQSTPSDSCASGSVALGGGGVDPLHRATCCQVAGGAYPRRDPHLAVHRCSKTR